MEKSPDQTGGASRLSDTERRRRFFYAETAAGMYDGTIELVVPQYRLMHESMMHLLHRSLGGREEITGSVLDVGAGTGMESIRVMQEFPHLRVVALDLCLPMHSHFRANYAASFPETPLSERCSLVLGDILGAEGEPSALLDMLPEGEEGYEAVISAFTFHHFAEDDKEEVYRRLYEVLIPGGVLINGDLFSYQSPSLSRYADEYDRDWIARQFKSPDSDFDEALNIPARTRDRLAEDWLKHYKEDNSLSPVEGGLGHDATVGQAEMLRRAGFTEVGCPFRFWQVGLLWAKK